MRIFRSYLPVICLILCCSCKKLIANKEHDVILAIMTVGQWHVEQFMQGTINITDQFQGYNFQFNEDGSVTGNNGSVTVAGTWVGDVRNYSISSDFPLAEDPVKKLNGTWVIKDSSKEYVAAEKKIAQEIMILHLRKTP